MKAWVQRVITTTLITMALCAISLPLIALYKAKPHTREDAVLNPGPWTNLGTVSNGIRSGLVMRRQDPDSGATIYVLIGTELGGIYVLPQEKTK